MATNESTTTVATPSVQPATLPVVVKRTVIRYQGSLRTQRVYGNAQDKNDSARRTKMLAGMTA